MESLVVQDLNKLRERLTNRYPKLDKYNGVSVLLTGGTGFKGSWLKNLLLILGAKVDNIDINSISTVGDFSPIYCQKSETYCMDIACFETVEYFKDKSYDYIFHMAAQPLVIPSVSHPVYTWRTNVMGTVHALEIARNIDNPVVCIVVTSDKVYKNTGTITDLLSEDSILGGLDPYSSSKSACEFAVNSWSHTFNNNKHLRIATVRGGNVIGGGDYSDYRLIPDIYKAYRTGSKLMIRSPFATRPWQHVIDSSIAYLLFGSTMVEATRLNHPNSLNIGPAQSSPISVSQVCQVAQEILPGFRYETITKDREEQDIEHLYLSLDTTLMASYLGFKPALGSYSSIEHALNWYQDVHHNKNDRVKATINAIDCYLST